jgi:iron complex transport system substrate-binding protein
MSVQKLFFLLTIVALVGGCTPIAAPESTVTPLPTSGNITMTDGTGETITLTAPANRIISLAPSNTEILFALGAGSQVIGRDAFSDFPDQAKNVADIGGGFGELNLEAILAQNPDLVLSSMLTSAEQTKALEDAGLTVFTLGNPKNFDDLYANLDTVGKLTGHGSEADILVAELKQRVALVQEKLAKITQRPLVFYEIDGTDPNAVWTSGPGTFIDMLINMSGGDNLGANLQGEWVQISLEELIASDPDLILLGDSVWGGVTVDSVKSRAGWEALTAVQNDKIFPFDDNLVSRPGPRLVNGLEELAHLLHPDLFQ